MFVLLFLLVTFNGYYLYPFSMLNLNVKRRIIISCLVWNYVFDISTVQVFLIKFYTNIMLGFSNTTWLIIIFIGIIHDIIRG